jgi:hypothetical protein
MSGAILSMLVDPARVNSELTHNSMDLVGVLRERGRKVDLGS